MTSVLSTITVLEVTEAQVTLVRVVSEKEAGCSL